MALKRADVTSTRRFTRGEDLGEGRVKREPDDAWIELRVKLSKHEDAIINDSTGVDRIVAPEGVILRAKSLGGDPKVFEMLAVGWSLEGGKPKVEDYEALDAQDAAWVDECLGVAIETARGEAMGKDISPVREDQPKSGPTSSVAEDAPPSTD
jgi:hypothetical protein